MVKQAVPARYNEKIMFNPWFPDGVATRATGMRDGSVVPVSDALNAFADGISVCDSGRTN